MQFLKKLLAFKQYHEVTREILQNLFATTGRTLIPLIILETILFFMLLPCMGNVMYLWYGSILFLSLSRLYDGYRYKKYPQKHPLSYWHKQFIIKAWITAFMLGILALYTIPQLSDHYQLFVFMILIGISGGAVTSLSAGHRLAIGYIMILLLPVSVEMLFLQTWNTVIIGLLLILYFITLTNVVFHDHDIDMLMKQKNEEIAKVQSELHDKQEMLALFFEQAPIEVYSYIVLILSLQTATSPSLTSSR